MDHVGDSGREHRQKSTCRTEKCEYKSIPKRKLTHFFATCNKMTDCTFRDRKEGKPWGGEKGHVSEGESESITIYSTPGRYLGSFKMLITCQDEKYAR